MATPPEDSVEIIHSSVNSQVYETVASLEENEFRIFLEEVTSQDRKKADKSAIAQAAQILLRKEEDALKEESGSGEDAQELLSACHKRKRLKGKGHCDNSSSAAARTSTGGSLGSLQDLTETKVPETSSAAGTKSGGSCGNLSRGSFKTQAPLKQRAKRLKIGRASTSIREGGSLQNLSKAEAASNETKKLHKSGSLSQVFTDICGARLKNRRQKTSSESSGCRTGRKSEEKDVGSDGECTDIPYRLLITSPLPAATEADKDSGGCKLWNRDRMSDVASGESTEEDGESFHSVARSKLSDANMSSYTPNETELMSVVTHLAHKDNGNHIVAGDAEVDKKIKFNLAGQENSLESGRSHMSLLAAGLFEGKLSSRIIDQENGEKKYKNGKNDTSDKITGDRRIFDTMSEFLPKNRTFNYLQKSSSENPHIKVSDSNHSLANIKTSHDDSAISHRSNGYSNGSTKEYNYIRMKAKCEKKKILRKKNEIPIEETPGYVGDAPFSEILTFINNKNSNQKGKKKHKSKKEDCKDDKENNKRKKNGERISNNISALTKPTTVWKESDDLSDSKDLGRKKGKSSSLRGTSSVEDLVSKSKQNERDLFVKKQITVEDGDVSPYLNKFSDDNTVGSEFCHDFYQVGDAMLNDDIMHDSGEFEVVNRKKSRKNRIMSIPLAEKVESSVNKVIENDKQKRFSPPRGKVDKKGGCRPAINFSEGLKFDGDVIFNKWPSNKGSNCDRIGHTTSAPHSEGSDSDGNDSVHSMPVKSMTRKPELRHHPQSSDSTPQASYANIAKLSSKKKLGKCSKTSKMNSSLELRKADSNLSDFPPLAENYTPDVSVQDDSGVFSTSDLTISMKIRRNSVSNELLISKRVVTYDNDQTENEIVPAQESFTSSYHNSNNQCYESCQQNDVSVTERKSNIAVKTAPRKEPRVNPPKTNVTRYQKVVCTSSSKAEPAVVFTDKANVSESVRDIEFGFGVGLEEMLPNDIGANVTKSDSTITPTVSVLTTSHSKKAIRNDISVADLFRNLFVPPKAEVFPHHEELCTLFSSSWENTLKMMKEDPENIQIWRCPPRCNSPSKMS